MKSSKIQVTTSHYFSQKYDTKERWSSYWYQIHEVVAKQPNNVLEIGVGNKVVSDYLKKIGLKVTTCDFDKSLKSDVVANILSLSFQDKSFDLVLCAEVLEHLPFSKFPKALSQIYRISRKFAVITIPHFSLTNLYLGIKLIPFIPKAQISLKIDLPIKHKFLGEHYWEIGKGNYPLKRIKAHFEKAGFKLENDYYPHENPKHHFFILKKPR